MTGKGSPKAGARGSASRPKSSSSAGSAKSNKSAKGKPKPSAGKKEEAAPPASECAPPEDIFPLVLTSKTQELFQCRADEDLTQENPYKLLRKEDILLDVKTRGVVSDFQPFKQLVLDYPEEEILLVYDRDFKYGNNFYLVGSEEKKEQFLHPPEASTQEEEEEAQEAPYKPPESKLWISLGSEVEIEDESIKDHRQKICFKISRIRREFGAPVKFSDHSAVKEKENYVECPSYQDKTFNIKQMEKNAGIQAIPMLVEASTQTKWKYPKNACTQYSAQEFSDEEKQKLFTSKSLKDFINSVSIRFEIALQQNEIMNAFIDDWKVLGEEESSFGGKTDTHLKEYQSFTDLHFSKNKAVSFVNWHPSIPGIIAVAVREKYSFEERINFSAKLLLTHALILIWSFSDPIHPQLLLECPDDVYCFEFCPSDPSIIVGGCMNGQIALWDISAHMERLQSTRTGGGKHAPAKATSLPGFEDPHANDTPVMRYCAVSSIESGHKAPVTDVQWLPDYYEVSRLGTPVENSSGMCLQIMTCSPDCTVFIWDVRAPKAPLSQMTDRKKAEEKRLDILHEIPDTFKHLDLTWKPLIKVALPKLDGGGEYSSMKFSLVDSHRDTWIHGNVDKFHPKTEKLESGIDYATLRVPSAKNLKGQSDVSTKFSLGTEDGELVYADWKMEKDNDTGKLSSSKPSNCFVIHDGLLNTVQRSPFFKDIVLTVGGWTFAIWKEDIMSGPLLQSCCSQKRCTVGHWSISRPGVFFIGKEDGSIDIWDLLEKTHEPSQTQNICTAPITCIKPWIMSSRQHLLAVSDEQGTVYILEIPWTIRHPSNNEKTSVSNYFEREVKHLQYFEARKLFREREKSEMEADEQKRKAEAVPPEKTAEQLEMERKTEYEEYLEVEKKILIQVGILQEAEEPLPTV
ncbi:dynein axonemal intermediate chain 3 [Erpetoichthys calabaricus]|uniref:Dynein axonemal intermediate chain 3 n=1 Tax=Erpetoichthys calabaricus TaxID=27687 RepID=A0A8C4SCE8_ERPCA|nr:dynein axonemal intermediate chain 3 [Erpetoichthys calabaricus]